MNGLEDIEKTPISRRGLLTRLGAAGAGAAATALIAGCGGSSGGGSGSNQNQQIINAAATAEALAVVMYYNIIHTSPLFSTGLAAQANDQGYLNAALQQESNHYNLLISSGAVPLAQTFYFPTGMFSDTTYQVTLNTLEKLEYAFIAAYLIGIRDFSTSSLKVLAGQIMGVECEHRVLARDIASDVNLTSLTELGGASESVVPPSHSVNNLAYERTYSSTLPNIAAVVTALGPFVSPGSTGFSTTPFAFNTTPGFYSTTSPVTLDQLTP